MCKNKCTECKEATRKTAGNMPGSRYTLYCTHHDMMRMVDMSISPTAVIEAPDWCPLEKIKKNKENGILSYQDKVDLLMKFKPCIEWDDLKENQVYHVPKLPGEERKDIVITRKSAYSCSYKRIGDKYGNTVYTIYPSSLMVRFLTEHKIKEFVPINK